MGLPQKFVSEARLDERARALTDKALQTIEDIMAEGEKDSDRLNAANSILDRGYGKPIQASIALPATKKAVQRLMGLSDEELERIALSEEQPDANPPPKTLSEETYAAFAQLPDDPAMVAVDPAAPASGEFDGAPDTPAATSADFDTERFADDIKPATGRTNRPNRFADDPLL